jgi:ADP-heptose:LPS heptosyltransferase
MSAVLDRLRAGARVAIVRQRSLGDCVLTTPAIELLGAYRPDLRLAVVVEDWCRPVFEGNRRIEALLPPDGWALRNWSPDLCVNLHGGPRSFWLTMLSGARWRAGFGHYRHARWYNVRMPRAQEVLGVERRVHTAEHLASAMFYLGVPLGEVPRARIEAEPSQEAKEYAVLHPFASEDRKRWPADRFGRLANWLKDQGLRVLVIGTPDEDWGPFAEWERRDRLTVGGLKSVIQGSALFVGNDSGPAHLAAALGVPMLALFGPSDFDAWCPWRARGGGLRAPEGDLTRLGWEEVRDAAASLMVAA